MDTTARTHLQAARAGLFGGVRPVFSHLPELACTTAATAAVYALTTAVVACTAVLARDRERRRDARKALKVLLRYRARR